MKKADAPEPLIPDPVAFGRILADVMQRAEPMMRSYMENQAFELKEPLLDPHNLSPAYIQLFTRLWSDPVKLAGMQMQFWNDWTALWQESGKKFLGQPAQDLYTPDKGDRRFKSAAWTENALFDFIKQSYLMTGNWMTQVVKSADGLDSATRRKVDFYTRQFIDAMAPSNFLLTNPDALKETMDSNGDNLVRGLQHLMSDLERGQGSLKISTTSMEAFEVGRNLAITPGKVIWQNDIMQLIQYNASTEKVSRTPLLVVPPWINKYYILDLQPENSLLRWMVDQGHTVFVISWVNPDKSLADKRFDDYMQDGLLTAMEKVRVATGEASCNLFGYCLGGTLMAMTLAWLAAKDRSDEVKSATFMTTLIDFEHAGDLHLFMDDAKLEQIERDMAEKGFLEAESFRRTFSLLRANDMVWSFVVNNYLMGREPFPFDLLYWNEDATNMPSAMHSFYLRKLYRENLLSQPGCITLAGEPLDIGKIAVPSYFVSTKEDHIAPWMATYKATQLFNGPVRFTLGASGHVAGVVNHPGSNKYCYWTAEANPPEPQAWLESAQQKNGSWWTDWQRWIAPFDGGRVKARTPGGGKLKPIEDAPGSYVRTMSDA